LSPHTDFIDSAAGAFSGRATTFDGPRRFQSSAGARNHRRAQDRGVFWVRITLLIVVSALLLCVGGISRALIAAGGTQASPDHQNEH